MHGSGAWLFVTPDRSIRSSVIPSSNWLAAAQYRAGLFLSALAPALKALTLSPGFVVTDAMRLGDDAIHTSHASIRHHDLNRIFRDAASAALSCRIQLGDKGDYSLAAQRAALQRFAHLSPDHVPDIIIFDEDPTHPHLYETKCYSSLRASNNNGARGAASGNHGHLFDFGATEEDLLVKLFGTRERGDPSGPKFSHETGTGYIPYRKGCYERAVNKLGNPTHLLLADTLSGLASGARGFLNYLNRTTKAAKSDNTVYGVSRASTRDFLTHHTRRISTSVATSISVVILNAARNYNGRAAQLASLPLPLDPTLSAPETMPPATCA